ncbi:MAG: hypothetical protein EBS81_10020, partial [Gammaproteobacteria bacterium]|nr:hypothetical protein [Gammaproteobacteria bacterium]
HSVTPQSEVFDPVGDRAKNARHPLPANAVFPGTNWGCRFPVEGILTLPLPGLPAVFHGFQRHLTVADGP